MTGVLMLLGLLAACDEGAPPPTGSIEGTVSIGGTGTDGVTVTLSDGKTATTAGGGAYRFAGVEVGSYTVTISGYPSDAKFDATQASAVVATANQVVRLNFTGSYTSSIQGDVAIEGMPLPGVTVTLSGGTTTQTSADGSWAFTGLRAGSYTVTISGYPYDVSFEATQPAVITTANQVVRLYFNGTYIRTSEILGSVTVAGDGLPGVTVTASGGWSDRTTWSDSTTTQTEDGLYAFTGLRAGTYTVAISGFDNEAYSFSSTSKSATMTAGETAVVNFTGMRR